MSARTQTVGVSLAIVVLALLTTLVVRFSFISEARLASPALNYIQSSVAPSEVTRCPGELIGTTYDFVVERPTVAAISIHYIPVDAVMEEQQPVAIGDTTLLFYQEAGRHTFRPDTRVPLTLEPGSYNRYVVAQFEGALLTSYRQLVHVVPCERSQELP